MQEICLDLNLIRDSINMLITVVLREHRESTYARRGGWVVRSKAYRRVQGWLGGHGQSVCTLPIFNMSFLQIILTTYTPTPTLIPQRPPPSRGRSRLISLQCFSLNINNEYLFLKPMSKLHKSDRKFYAEHDTGNRFSIA